MNAQRESVLGPLLATILGYVAWEVYLALRPPDLTEQLRSWLGTTHGRFEQFYAEWRQQHGDDDGHPGAPLGE